MGPHKHGIGELFLTYLFEPGGNRVESDHEYYGPMIPRIMRHLRACEFDEATELYWQIHPARRAKAARARS